MSQQNNRSRVIDPANRLTDDGTDTYSYDNNGNLTQKTNKTDGSITQYIYDAEDRLIEGTVPVRGLSLKYAYDPLGRRIQKSVNGNITKYVYDNEDIIAEYDSNNSLVSSYVHGPGIDEPLILEKAGQKYYYHTDSLGSVTAITDSTGTVIQSYQYDSFGNIVSQTGSLTQPYAYTAREYDPETGLYYYRARYYDPKIGRCIGKISCENDEFFVALDIVAKEIHRILRSTKTMAWLIGDQCKKKKFIPVGWKLYEILTRYFTPVDLVCISRHNQTSNTPIWHERARRFNFYLRGFKYLLIMKKLN